MALEPRTDYRSLTYESVSIPVDVEHGQGAPGPGRLHGARREADYPPKLNDVFAAARESDGDDVRTPDGPVPDLWQDWPLRHPFELDAPGVETRAATFPDGRRVLWLLAPTAPGASLCEAAALDPAQESPPAVGVEMQKGTAGVLAVADGSAAGEGGGDFDAVALGSGVRGSPEGAYNVGHDALPRYSAVRSGRVPCSPPVPVPPIVVGRTRSSKP